MGLFLQKKKGNLLSYNYNYNYWNDLIGEKAPHFKCLTNLNFGIIVNSSKLFQQQIRTECLNEDLTTYELWSPNNQWAKVFFLFFFLIY